MCMKSRTRLIIVLLGMIGITLLGGTVRAGLSPDPYEPNESIQTARAVTSGTYECNFDRLGDVDYYNISITSGDQITVGFTIELGITVQLSDPAGLITTNAITPTTGEVVHVATYTGNHTILVTGTGGSYTMVISVGDPPAETPGYEPVLVMAVSLAAIVAVYLGMRSKAKSRQ
jgi:hypothetical protein